MPVHVICLYMALIMYCSVKMLNVVYAIMKFYIYIYQYDQY